MKHTPESRAAIGAAHTIHGFASRNKGKTKEYKTWLKIKERCCNPRSKDFPRYQGLMAEAWRNDFPAFLAEVGPAPTRQHSIGRINNECGYEPGNVRWETPVQQSRNTRRNRIVTFRGERMPLVRALELAGIGSHVFKKRTKNGMSEHDALETPLATNKSHRGRRGKGNGPASRDAGQDASVKAGGAQAGNR